LNAVNRPGTLSHHHVGQTPLRQNSCRVKFLIH
jgi:hypothetical protein